MSASGHAPRVCRRNENESCGYGRRDHDHGRDCLFQNVSGHENENVPPIGKSQYQTLNDWKKLNYVMVSTHCKHPEEIHGQT